MRRCCVIMCVLISCLVTSGQTQAPKPGPELQRLRAWVGHWKGDVKTNPTPWGPGGKYAVEENDQMILGGYFLESRAHLKENGVRELWVVGYDALKKNYPATDYSSDGRITSWTFSGNGNTWTCLRVGRYTVAGKSYLVRTTVVFTADKMSRTDRSEISEDGNSWITTATKKMARISSSVSD